MDIFGIKSSDDSVNLYFVQSVGSCSKEMRTAFTVSQNANLNSNIVYDSEVDELPKKKNCVYILDEFKGETFKKLASKECLVVGPKCLSTCITKRMAIPANQSPVFNLAMNGLIVCATKLKRSKKEELATSIGYMGGHYQDQLTLATTHLVADGWKSFKCEEANEHGIPVMCSSWVKAVWEESLKNDDIGVDFFTKYRLPTFKGFYITCSNLPQSVKVKLQKVIEGNGGVYMPSLEQNKTSLLIIGDPVDGKKFQHAQLWNIPCIKPSWLHESAEKLFPLSFKNYLVSARPKCSTPTSDLPSFMSNDVSAVPVISEISNMEINETNTTLGSVCSLDRGRGRSKKLDNPKC